MRVIGLTRVRNEEEIIKDTLDHWGQYCDEIFVYDDASTDRTVEIARAHPKVRVIEGREWKENREEEEWVHRQILLLRGKSEAGPDDWFCYFDADEFLYDFSNYSLFKTHDAIACRLFDVYITPEDVEKSWKEREWIGPEFREIVFFFKNSPALRYYMPDQREVTLGEARVACHGTIKHFGKGFSVKHHEATCDYYINHFPKYSKKWRERRGRAVHTQSDFNHKLIRWEERSKGFPL